MRASKVLGSTAVFLVLVLAVAQQATAVGANRFTVKRLPDYCGTHVVPARNSPTGHQVTVTLVRDVHAPGVPSCVKARRYVADYYAQSPAYLMSTKYHAAEGPLDCGRPDENVRQQLPVNVMVLSCVDYRATQDPDGEQALQVFRGAPSSTPKASCSSAAIARAVEAADRKRGLVDDALTGHACWRRYAIAAVSNECCGGHLLMVATRHGWRASRLGSAGYNEAVYDDLRRDEVSIPFGVALSLFSAKLHHEHVRLH